MPIFVSNLTTSLEEPGEAAIDKAIAKLGISRRQVEKAYLVKSSLDARKRGEIHFVHTVGICCEMEEEIAQKCKQPGVTYHCRYQLERPKGSRSIDTRPVVAGFGPAGMFAGLLLARWGFAPLILERGACIERRVELVDRFWKTGQLSPRGNVQFGEGGAGTFSDGKLTTRIGDPRCEFVLEELVAHGAPPEIAQKAKPHIGTDYLRGVVRAIREEILSLGGEIRFETPLTQVGIQDGSVRWVEAGGEKIPCELLILALGHSARYTFYHLAEQGVALVPKAFSVGVRIEHLQQDIDRGLYGKLAGHPALPVGEYQLSLRRGDRGVYTFCMCPGGFVVPSSSEEGGVVTNGMSEYLRNQPNANSAVVVSVNSQDFGNEWDSGIQFQRHLEQAAFAMGDRTYQAPAQTVGNFLSRRPGLSLGAVIPSYALGVVEGDFWKLFPSQVSEMLAEGMTSFGRKLPGFAASDAVLTGVETRTSSPVRIPRTELLEAQGIKGIYPCGEGAGYAGGIMSAAVDGVRIAQQIASCYRPN